ncbi:unnamed protein product [Ophioblennius macclurei]
MLLVLRAPVLLALASLLQPSWTGRTVSERPRRPPGAKQRSVKLCLDPSVPMKVPGQFSSNAANMSLSPWKFRESFVESRIPRRISQAECLTTSCPNPWGGEQLEVRPIKYQVLVLHIVPRQSFPTGQRRRQKKYKLRLGMEEITVGCTCVRPNVLLQP